jgi:hypothetical protein
MPKLDIGVPAYIEVGWVSLKALGISVMVYAVFSGDRYYHVVLKAGESYTVCGLSTKGSARNVRELRSPARVISKAPRLAYVICHHCAVSQVKHNRPPAARA